MFSYTVEISITMHQLVDINLAQLHLVVARHQHQHETGEL